MRSAEVYPVGDVTSAQIEALSTTLASTESHPLTADEVERLCQDELLAGVLTSVIGSGPATVAPRTAFAYVRAFASVAAGVKDERVQLAALSAMERCFTRHLPNASPDVSHFVASTLASAALGAQPRLSEQAIYLLTRLSEAPGFEPVDGITADQKREIWSRYHRYAQRSPGRFRDCRSFEHKVSRPVTFENR
jgi:hypothetical protein